MKTQNEMETKLSVKNDVIFKELFSKKGNETFLQDFLSGLLDKRIEKIEIIKDASLTRRVESDKLGIIDIKATLDDNIVVDIEMQMSRYKNMEDRALYYSSKLISSQLKSGEFYGTLKKVIVIVILDYNVYPYEEYITQTKTVVDKNEKYEVMKKQKFYFIELPKYRKKKFNAENKVSQWLAFIDGENKERKKEAMVKNKVIEKANEEYEYLTGDEEIQRIAELKQKWELDYNSLMHDSFEDGVEEGRKIGINKGISVGKNETRIEIVKAMLKNNFEIKVISKITNLSIEEIEKIKKSSLKVL